MNPVAPAGRVREKLRSGEIPPEAEELADRPEARENTLFDRFMTNLGSNPGAPASLGILAVAESSHVPIDRSELPDKSSDTSSYENAMMTMMEVRDDLVSRFPSVSNDRSLYNLFTTSIHKIEDGLRKLGMEVDAFNPLTSLSGLASNDEMLVNAREVVANTTRRYTLHKIADIRAEVWRGVPSVAISIEGEDGGTKFMATGRIVAPEDFSGNEAVDFVAKGGECALGVKAITLGRSVDVSNRFSIDFDVIPVEDKTPSVPVEQK